MRPARLVGLVVLALAVLAGVLVLARLRWEERPSVLQARNGAAEAPARNAVLAPLDASPSSHGRVPSASAATSSSASPADNAAPTEETDQLVLAVFDPDGGQLAGARTVLFREAHILGQAVTDGTGEARFKAEEGRGEVAVWSASLPAHRQTLEELRGRQEIRLERGTAVAGLVLVDGLPPTEPFELLLESDSQVRPTEFFPPEVGAALGLGLGAFDALRARVGEDGRFRFAGLPVPWSGRLRWEADVCLSDGSYDAWGRPLREVELAEAREDVALGLEAPGVIRARFVDTDGGTLDPGTVRLGAPWGADISFAHRTDAEGAYHGYVKLPLPDELTLSVNVSWRRTYILRFKRPGSAVLLWDLGDVVVPPAPELRVRVRDAMGLPVANAMVGSEHSLEDVPDKALPLSVLERLPRSGGLSAPARERQPTGRTQERSELTDEAGIALISVAEDVERISVRHSDYAPALTPAPDDLRATVDVTLRRKTSLQLELDVLPAGSGSGLCGTLMAGEPRRSTTAARVSPLRTGLSNIDGLNVVPADVPLCLRLTDCLGRLVHEELLAPLAPDTTAQHAVKVDWQPVTLSLRVLDATGHPLEHATVLLGGRYQRRTGPDGRLELPALAPGPLTVTVAHPSHTVRTLSHITLGAESEPFDVYLVHR